MTNDGRRDPRQPLAFKIRFKSATLNDFVEKHSRDLSRGGIFIKMATPLPVGTLIKFDVRLEDEQSLIQGVGRVVWRREAAREDAPAGMGIKFIKLDTTSRENLETLLEGRSENGPPGEAPTVEQQVGVPSRPPQPISPVRPVSVPKDAKRTMMGVGVAPELKAAATRSETSGQAAVASTGNSQPPRDFLADINEAIGDVLQDGKARAPVTPKPSGDIDIFDEGPTRVAVSSETPGEVYDRVIVDSKAVVREDETPTGLQSVDAAAASSAVGDWNEEGDEFDRTVARPLLSEDIARKAEELETKPKAPPVSPPKAEPVKPAEPKPSTSAPQKEAKDVEPVVAPKGEPVAPERPTLPTPPAATRRGGGAIFAVVGLLLVAAAGLAYWYFVLQSGESPSPQPSVVQPEKVAVTAEPAPTTTAPIATSSEAPATSVAADTASVKAVSFGLAEVTSTPEGAAIFVAGQAKGQTPVTLEGLEPGVEIEVTAKLFGYKTATVKVTPTEEGAKVAIKLEPAVVQVVVESDPPDARVFLAGDWIGKTPRTAKLKGKGPQLEYKLQKPGYEELDGTIQESDWTEVDGVFTATVKVALTKAATPETPSAASAAVAPDKPAQEKRAKSEKKPVTEEPQMAAEEKKPAAEEKKPAAEEKKPAAEEKKPSVDENPF